MNATRKSVTIRLHAFHHLREGRISHLWHLEDWFGCSADQIGARQPAQEKDEKGGNR
jgi:hypothetical protein